MRTNESESRRLCGSPVWTSNRAMKPRAPALRASSASMRSDSWRSRASTLWREMTASETQPTAVLRDSKAVSSTMSGFERRSLRATRSHPQGWPGGQPFLPSANQRGPGTTRQGVASCSSPQGDENRLVPVPLSLFRPPTSPSWRMSSLSSRGGRERSWAERSRKKGARGRRRCICRAAWALLPHRWAVERGLEPRKPEWWPSSFAATGETDRARVSASRRPSAVRWREPSGRPSCGSRR